MNVQPVLNAVLRRTVTPRQGGGKEFKEVMQQVRDRSSISDFHKDLQGLYQRLESGKAPAPHELLAYQMKASEFHLWIELVSKTAESGLTALRKFQGTQG